MQPGIDINWTLHFLFSGNNIVHINTQHSKRDLVSWHNSFNITTKMPQVWYVKKTTETNVQGAIDKDCYVAVTTYGIFFFMVFCVVFF